MAKLFGTDGIRGQANTEVTGELAYKIGRCAGFFLCKDSLAQQGSDAKPVMLMGKDTRISGDMLEAALTAGITSVGIDVIQLGIIPTPGVCYLTEELEVCGGVMISASHNPIADNGIKFFDTRGYKLSDSQEEEIEDYIFAKKDDIPVPTHEKIGKVEVNEELTDSYINYLAGQFKGDFSKLKVVLDCANGAAYRAAPGVLQKLGVELEVINDEPDGSKINVDCGSTSPGIIAERVRETAADLGIAHDGDADRVLLVDEKGTIVDGDRMMAILALDLLNRGELKKKTLVTTRYSNFGLQEALKKQGARVEIARNGDRYVLQKILANDYILGGEKSGHIINLKYNNTGDGICTALQILDVIRRTGQSLAELAGCMQEWPQQLSNVRVDNKDNWQTNRKIQQTIEQAQKDLGDSGRVFVRASGTEPVIRILLEGKEEAVLEKWQQRLSTVIAEELTDSRS